MVQNLLILDRFSSNLSRSFRIVILLESVYFLMIFTFVGQELKLYKIIENGGFRVCIRYFLTIFTFVVPELWDLISWKIVLLETCCLLTSTLSWPILFKLHLIIEDGVLRVYVLFNDYDCSQRSFSFMGISCVYGVGLYLFIYFYFFVEAPKRGWKMGYHVKLYC